MSVLDHSLEWRPEGGVSVRSIAQPDALPLRSKLAFVGAAYEAVVPAILSRLLLSLRPGQPRRRNGPDPWRLSRRSPGLPPRVRKYLSRSTLPADSCNRRCLFLYAVCQTTLAIRDGRIHCRGRLQPVLGPAGDRQPGRHGAHLLGRNAQFRLSRVLLLRHSRRPVQVRDRIGSSHSPDVRGGHADRVRQQLRNVLLLDLSRRHLVHSGGGNRLVAGIRRAHGLRDADRR